MPMKNNDQLVDYLVNNGHITSERVEKAFRNVDRANFVPENPYMDRPAYLEEGSTVSAPHIVAQMLELLEPTGRVLEMGSGSGYVLALLAELADEVVGVERIERLVKESRDKVPEATVVLGDSIPEGEFDCILYSFATEDIEDALEKAEIVVVPEQADGEQVLKKYVEGEPEAYGRVRFVEERTGVKND